ncbi:DNA polymerase III subunit delta [[Eubacterium] hominis]|uniref:DNA polymerase III subunit delta n=1 Tax=[Eubacterium] hominis TaxID=2764325 RepID=UPI003A4D2051
MFKETLKLQQPVVYHTLKHALENDKLAHAYMFSGPSGTPKKQTAYLLAQSLVCEESGFACEECDVCQRVIHNEYADLIYIDGTTTSIKKDDIIKLQENFNKTGLEAKGKKVYILDHAENATPDALNSLLKFLEEPTNDMIAILIVEQLERVLATIVSRCQNIPFTPLSFAQCFDEVKDAMPELDAYMLSNMIRNKDAILEAFESEDYQHALHSWIGTIDQYLIDPYQALLFLQVEGFPSKQKKYGKVAFTYVIDMLSIFFKDCMKQELFIKDTWYNEHVERMKQKRVNHLAMLQILMETRDKLLRSVNIQLLIDSMIYQMKEVSA